MLGASAALSGGTAHEASPDLGLSARYAVECLRLLIRQEEFYGREVITATREIVELESDEMIKGADKVDVAFLVVGDPLG
jgi:diphthamide biosynthesis methyltransferase